MAWLRSVPRAMVDRGEAIDEVVTEIGCEFLDEVLGGVLLRGEGKAHAETVDILVLWPCYFTSLIHTAFGATSLRSIRAFAPGYVLDRFAVCAHTTGRTAVL